MQEMQDRSRAKNIPWRRKWQLTLVFLLGKSKGQRSLTVVHGVTKSQTQLKQMSRQAWFLWRKLFFHRRTTWQSPMWGTHLNVTFIQVNKSGANSLLKYALTRQPWLLEMLESNNWAKFLNIFYFLTNIYVVLITLIHAKYDNKNFTNVHSFYMHNSPGK